MFEHERQELVDTLRKKGIKDDLVLNAINSIERHLFIPNVIGHHAYKDTALPIGYGQTISQPYTVAIMTQYLKASKNEKVLEIGTGSGYQAAILNHMGIKVYSIERNFEIYSRTQKLFDKMNLRVVLRCADGTLGWEEYAPFKGIIVTAGSPVIPENLKTQLAVGGKLVIPVGGRSSQVMKILTKISKDKYEIDEISNFTFVPLVGKQGWKEGQ
ncbi:MAG: protein-L-isoaspartate O-methyltransferase [Ignavibacteriae bacterium HGW-Ignavibacteriae-2]|jgi:protein-L-isoaspartate(D-aspartate) O-methyltransferase|nr:protein-L-isoaspartate(D-aspartate) O-methyltransferase [Bacteroidota bacterium]PKL88820.1 MAG: protein-L-isoaspartate O-methyltransferase [Ignavibacteriae bacterium HGW-Ignavibacteriae-2]